MAEQDRLADDAYREGLVDLLSPVYFGEIKALDIVTGWIPRVDDVELKLALAGQATDEAAHTRMLRQRIRKLGYDPDWAVQHYVGRTMREMFGRLYETDDWSQAVMGLQIMLESLAATVFENIAETADAETAKVLRAIINDERGHVGFGEAQIRRVLQGQPGEREHVLEVYHKLLPLFQQVAGREDSPRTKKYLDLGLLTRRPNELRALITENLNQRLRSLGVPV